MKYWRTTIYNTNGDLDDTEVVYCQAEDPGELLMVALDTHSKPVKDYEEVTQAVFDANQ